MRPRARRVTLLAIAVGAGACSHRSAPPSPLDAAPSASASAPPRIALPEARFSRPIAAGEMRGGVTVVAGLVVPRRAVAVTGLGPDGVSLWSRDVIADVGWSESAALSVFPSEGGAFVVWRGLRGGAETTVGVAIDASGNVVGDIFPVGATPCATDAAVAWLDHGTKGSWLVKSRSLTATQPSLAVALPDDRNPALVCGPKRLFALGEGDDDIILSTAEGGARTLSVRIAEDVEFGGDDERGHEVYVHGDVLGIVRVSASGRVAAREVVGATGHRSAWHRVPTRLSEDDDVALVDADAREAVLAVTSDASGAEAGGASRVEAIVWARDGSRDAVYDVAPADAAVVRGPFWSGAVKGGVAIGWAERSSAATAEGAPIAALGYRVVSLDGAGELHRVAAAMDDLIDAGCDDVRCYGVALVRAPGEDGGQPETVRVLPYP